LAIPFSIKKPNLFVNDQLILGGVVVQYNDLALMLPFQGVDLL